MRQKFFISFNLADRDKAHWIAWTLKEAGHEVAVHDWEIPAGGNAPLWMNTKLAWADRLVAVISPDYIPARYSPIEWASQIWNDPDGTKGSVIPVIVRPTSNIPPLLRDLSRIDLTNCSEAEAKDRLTKGVAMPAPPERKPAFAEIRGEPPDSQHAGPAEKPTFVRVSDRPWVYFAEVSVQAPLSYDAEGANVVLAYIIENVGGSPANGVRVDAWPLAFQVGRNDPIEHQLFHLKTLKERNDAFAAVKEVQQGLVGITLFRGEKRGFGIRTRINQSELDEASKYSNGAFLIMVSAVIEYKFSGSDRVHRTCRIFHVFKDGGMGIKVSEGDVPVNRLAVKPHFQGDCAD